MIKTFWDVSTVFGAVSAGVLLIGFLYLLFKLDALKLASKTYKSPRHILNLKAEYLEVQKVLEDKVLVKEAVKGVRQVLYDPHKDHYLPYHPKERHPVHYNVLHVVYTIGDPFWIERPRLFSCEKGDLLKKSTANALTVCDQHWIVVLEATLKTKFKKVF